MAKKKYPEQRSSVAGEKSVDHPSQPSGNEVYADQPTRSTAEGGARRTAEMNEIEERSEEIIAEALEDIQRAAREYYSRVLDAAGRLSGRAADAFGSGQTYVRNHPGSTVLGVIAAGIVIGLLISRR